MKMTQPLISVILPVYNVELYLEQCLTSIVNQTYSYLEIIVVNDGSTDNSSSIIGNFASRDSRIKVVNKENSGISAARDSGIEVATGDYIMFVDSDDWVESTIIEILLSKIQKYDLVVCSYNRYYQNNYVKRVFDIEGMLLANDFQRRLIGLVANELNDPSQGDSLVTVWGKLYKLSIIKNMNLEFVSTKDIGTCEDLIFNIEYVKYIDKVYIMNLPLYNYRKNNISSFTSRYKENLFYQWRNLFKQIKNLISDNNYFVSLNNRIALSIIGLGLNEVQNPKGFSNRIKNIKQILNDPQYNKAYKQLQLNYFPFHWKLFFVFAKYKFALGVYFMLLGINHFVNKNN